MQNSVETLLLKAQQLIKAAKDSVQLEQIRVQYLGKKGELTGVLKSLGNLSADERPKLGKIVNQAKEQLKGFLDDRVAELKHQELDSKLLNEVIDVTLPGRGSKVGSLHPVMRILERMSDIFLKMGFSIEDGPEIEKEYYNFEALNMPSSHPARAMHDTFYFADGSLLRSQTTTVQIRCLEKQAPPIQMIAPGKVYRRDFDVTHTPMFHQLEGLLVDEDVSFADLKGVLIEFLQSFFNEKLAVRFRPSYFPFTEPSAEVDVQCVMCHGSGCRVCKNSGWLEVLGCGMVHPNVFKNIGLDAEKYTGYAFGMGIDRITMLYYGINDLRMLFENDLRFLRQF